MASEGQFWRSIREALGGWKALVVVAVGSATATAVAGEVWRAPQVAQSAMERAETNSVRMAEIEGAIDRLERTVRIYLCTREDLDFSTRIRLECRELK